MGLSNSKAGKDLNTVLSFGMCEGCTIKEVIDDQQCGLIQYYVDNVPDFKLSKEADIYLKRNCHGRNEKCGCKSF